MQLDIKHAWKMIFQYYGEAAMPYIKEFYDEDEFLRELVRRYECALRVWESMILDAFRETYILEDDLSPEAIAMRNTVADALIRANPKQQWYLARKQRLLFRAIDRLFMIDRPWMVLGEKMIKDHVGSRKVLG